MYNYYKLLDISIDADIKTINNAYKYKILPYTFNKSLTLEQKQEIKALKTAHYILSNQQLREDYNTKLLNKYSNNEHSKFNYQTLDNNQNYDSGIGVFSLDDKITDIRKDKISPSIISDRIFDYASLRPSPNPNIYNIDLRKQEQTRIKQ
jgi:DnaJ-class molecular chaperone